MRSSLVSTLLRVATLGWLLASGLRADVVVPEPRGYFTDLTSTIGGRERGWLEANLLELKRKTGVEMAVLIVPDLQGTTVGDFAQKVYDRWKIGDAARDRGILFLIAPKDRKVRIQPGYGLEGDLPDGKVGGILDEHVMPSFRSGDVGGGIVRGVTAVMGVLGVTPVTSWNEAPPRRPRPSRKQGSPLGFIILLVIVGGLCVVSPFWRGMIFQILLQSMMGGGGRHHGRSGSFGGGSGFGGFGGGSSGGGGAERGW